MSSSTSNIDLAKSGDIWRVAKKYFKNCTQFDVSWCVVGTIGKFIWESNQSALVGSFFSQSLLIIGGLLSGLISVNFNNVNNPQAKYIRCSCFGDEETPCSNFIDFLHIVKTLIEWEGHVWSEGWVWDELHNGRFARTFFNSLPLSVLGTCLYLVKILIYISFQVYKNTYSLRRYHWEPLHRRDVKYVAGSRPWARQQAIYQLIASGICWYIWVLYLLYMLIYLPRSCAAQYA